MPRTPASATVPTFHSTHRSRTALDKFIQVLNHARSTHLGHVVLTPRRAHHHAINAPPRSTFKFWISRSREPSYGFPGAARRSRVINAPRPAPISKFGISRSREQRHVSCPHHNAPALCHLILELAFPRARFRARTPPKT
ncbi:hypothetical protein DFH09DRAFT_1323842 [Mycena vulgaris]|nr:hypothetical protein DFH09DRAFT_1323842 [Mycena vulgaris]